MCEQFDLFNQGFDLFVCAVPKCPIQRGRSHGETFSKSCDMLLAVCLVVDKLFEELLRLLK